MSALEFFFSAVFKHPVGCSCRLLVYDPNFVSPVQPTLADV